MGCLLMFEAENDNCDLDIDPHVDDLRPNFAGLNRFVEALITSLLSEANGIDEKDGISDKIDLKSVFGEHPFKKPRFRSTTCSSESSVDLNIADATSAKPFAYYDTNHESSLVDIIHNDGYRLVSPIGDGALESDWSVSKIADIYYNENEAEFCDASVWYRFALSINNTSQSSLYVAQVLDTQCGCEFHNIIGKEDIDGEVHYLVDWTPTLIRDIVLKKAQAQPLIDRFETRHQLPSATRCSLNANQTTDAKPLQQVVIKSNMQVGTGKPRVGPRKSPYSSDISPNDPRASRRDTAEKMLRRSTNPIRTPKVVDNRKLKIVKGGPETCKKLPTAMSSRGRVLRPRKIFDSGVNSV
ncbi:hypothetical protein SBOR_9205 [Sclerotinia borealis F-4128]|uniref:Uncharacterized protein n=1 Tax=Sclerotinia borealis (strain F-4128) TaxID=1432307 RepID=W9C0U3_SCLBF|nr:hypothetical protein SBOR_9205 [Sclerotinia borealis F-4128]